MPERLLAIPIEDEMRRSYLDYAMSVIIGRALPDIRDGLKPVHRRVLYAMHEMGLAWNRGYRKSARVAGDTLGKFHPHGEAPVYEALVRMAQDFSLRYPLVDGQGNFGSIDGDPPAAMRYTEVRLAKIAQEMLADIDRDTVDFVPNYDETQQEPVVLPARLPNLLVNGSSGIAVGMATNIPPHNLTEIIDGLLLVLENPAVTVEELMRVVKGPDFPTRGYIYGTAGIRDAFTTGRGSITMRARAHTEKIRGGREAIVVTELPYQVNKATLITKIAELSREGKLDGLSEIRDESDRHGIRVVMELAKGEIAADHPEPALQAHRDAVDLRRQHAGPRRPAAAGGDAPGDARALHRLPPGSRDPPHALRPRAGRGARPHPGGPPEGARPPRPGDPPDPGRLERRTPRARRSCRSSS